MALNKKMIATGVTCLAAAVGFSVLYYFNHSQGTPIGNNAIIQQIEIAETTEPAVEETTPTEYGPENGLTGQAKTLLQLNSDTVGWIWIPNTKVDYPVVQSEDNAFYMDKAFDYEPSRAGSIFMDYRNVFGFNEETQSDNIVIYGHNMANNSMFGSLRRYRQDYSYYETAPFIELSSNYDHYTYVIFALCITDGSGNATWRYWDMQDFATDEEFNDYVETAQRKSLVDIDVDVKPGDQLLTLQTCYSDSDGTRFLVIARKMRDGESAEDFLPEEETTEETTEEETEEVTDETAEDSTDETENASAEE